MKSENGSALVYVFIGVALFGALMFAFSRGGSQDSNGMTSKQAEIQAQAMISYADKVSIAVNKMLMNGVSENDLSFENVLVKDYAGNILKPPGVYPNCTTDGCKVFSSGGGNVKASIPTNFPPMDPTSPTYYPMRGGFIAHVIKIDGVGTVAPELVLSFHTLPKEVCMEINKLLKLDFPTNPPLGDGTTSSDNYSGAYPTTVITLGDGNDPWASKKSEFCQQYLGLSPPLYVYQKTLIVR